MHTGQLLIIDVRATALTDLMRGFLAPSNQARLLFGEGLVDLDDVDFQARRLESACLLALGQPPIWRSRPPRLREVHSELEREEEL